jgi:hypothetical protein
MAAMAQSSRAPDPDATHGVESCHTRRTRSSEACRLRGRPCLPVQATIRGTVDASLRAIVRQRQLQALAEALGTISLDLTPETLRQKRRKRTGYVPC